MQGVSRPADTPHGATNATKNGEKKFFHNDTAARRKEDRLKGELEP